jgi:hypothetical protein
VSPFLECAMVHVEQRGIDGRVAIVGPGEVH